MENEPKIFLFSALFCSFEVFVLIQFELCEMYHFSLFSDKTLKPERRCHVLFGETFPLPIHVQNSNVCFISLEIQEFSQFLIVFYIFLLKQK